MQSQPKLLEAKYTPEQLQKLSRLRALRKLQLSRRRTKQRSAIDLDEKQAIDIDQISKKNLAAVKERLRTNELLPPQEQKSLNNDKNKNLILTDKEMELFTVLMTKQHILHHTTSASLLQKIRETDNALLDAKEAERRGLAMRTATPEYCGAEENIYFGFGHQASSLPQFVRQRYNPETGKIEDYSTVQIDFFKLFAKHPLLLKSIWSGGHFAHYGQAFQHNKSPAMYIGGTEFYNEYDLENPYQTRGKKPVKYLHFNRQDGTQIKQTIQIDQEIASGIQFLQFFAFSFIERLRFIGGETQKHILNNPNDLEMINLLTEKLFRVDEFEIHIPTKVLLDDSYCRIITPQKRREITEAVSNAARDGDIARLARLKAEGYPLDGYMYEDAYIADEKPATDLPIVAAIKARTFGALRWLIANGANRSVFNIKTNHQYNALGETEVPATVANLKILAAAYELGDTRILQILLDNNFNLNEYYNSHAKSLIQRKPQNILQQLAEAQNPLASDAKSVDMAFAWVLTAVSKNGRLELLDQFMARSTYCNDASIPKEQLFRDIAIGANEAVFKHCLAKYPKIQLNYELLCGFAWNFNNSKLLPLFLSKMPKNSELLSETGLKESIIEKLKSGHFETAEVLIKFAKFDPAKMSEQEIFEILTSRGNDDAIFQKKMDWFMKHTKFNIHYTHKKKDCYDQTLLSYTVREQLYKSATYLIEECKVSLDISEDENAANPIKKALENNNTEFADYLVQKSMPIRVAKSDLIHALTYCNAQSVEWLIQHGVDHTTSDVQECFIEHGTAEIANVLQKHNKIPMAVPSNDDIQQCLKYWKKHHGAYREQIRELFSKKEMKATNYDARTKIREVANGSLEKIENHYPQIKLFNKAISACNLAMLKHLADLSPFMLDFHIDTLIEMLVSGNFDMHGNMVKIVEWFFDHGMTASHTDLFGVSIIDAIVQRDEMLSYDLAILKMLSQRGNNLSETIKEQGSLLLLKSVRDFMIRPSQDKIQQISWLLAEGADGNAVVKKLYMLEHDTTTPFLAACRINQPMLVRCFIEAGADVNLTVPSMPSFMTKAANKPSALHFACGFEIFDLTNIGDHAVANAEIISLLLDAGANPNAKYVEDNGKTTTPLKVLIDQLTPDNNQNDRAITDMVIQLLDAGAVTDELYGDSKKTIKEWVAAERSYLSAVIEKFELPMVIKFHDALDEGLNQFGMFSQLGKATTDKNVSKFNPTPFS